MSRHSRRVRLFARIGVGAAVKADGPFAVLPLARVARITLSAPLQAAIVSLEHGLARIPVTALKCDYTLRTATGQALLHGRTVGHVDSDDGVFLFAAHAGEPALNRVFVPRAAHLSCVFGPTASDRVSGQWIKDPATLRAALSSQRGKRMPRIGEAIEQLGFVTAQLDQHGRLGELLLRQGLLKPEQLQTALALKLGSPLVDLACLRTVESADSTVRLTRQSVRIRSLSRHHLPVKGSIIQERWNGDRTILGTCNSEPHLTNEGLLS